MWSSPQTFKCTSIDVLNALVTRASIWTVFPSLIGLSKEMLSTDAVTTGALQCFCADMAAAISIQYINLPPIRLPNTFVSLGRTISVIMTKLSEDLLDSIFTNFSKGKDRAHERLFWYHFANWQVIVHLAADDYLCQRQKICHGVKDQYFVWQYWECICL